MTEIVDRWSYRITVHPAAEILALVPPGADPAPSVIYCDDAGACYFDQGPNPFTRAIEQLLNSLGEQGWELVQATFRPEQMIGFWKRKA